MPTLSIIQDPTEMTELYYQYSRPVAKTYAHILAKDLTHRQQWWSSNHRIINVFENIEKIIDQELVRFNLLRRTVGRPSRGIGLTV